MALIVCEVRCSRTPVLLHAQYTGVHVCHTIMQWIVVHVWCTAYVMDVQDCYVFRVIQIQEMWSVWWSVHAVSDFTMNRFQGDPPHYMLACLWFMSEKYSAREVLKPDTNMESISEAMCYVHTLARSWVIRSVSKASVWSECTGVGSVVWGELWVSGGWEPFRRIFVKEEVW